MAHQPRYRHARGKIAEFAPALFVLFFLGLFPMLDLAWLGLGLGVIALAADRAASAASVETNYERSLNAMVAAASSVNSSAWTSFAGLTPVGGFSNCGADLFVKATTISSHAIDEWGPNNPVPPPVDVQNRVWEYKARARYFVRPLFNLSAVPVIGSVPGLGQAVPMEFVAYKTVEHPEGLGDDTGAGFGKEPDGSILQSLPTGTGGGGVLPDGVGWRTPTLYDLIAASGQKIIATDVLIVNANEPNWTSTNIKVFPGQTVWVDSRADGAWVGDGEAKTSESADGGSKGLDANGIPWFALEGGTLSAGSQTPLDRFMVGSTMFNHPLNNTGTFSLRMNDSLYDDNSGQQVVRIILTGPA